jgi:simple sugar transport system permease protein
LGYSLLVTLSNPVFARPDNLFDLLRNTIVVGILSVGAMMALISGGIDVSFTAVAAFSCYTTTKLLVDIDYQGGIVPVFVLSGSIGLLLGLVNAFFISYFRLPTLIVTLGTLSLFRGLLLIVVGSEYITELPPAMIRFSRWNLLEGATQEGVLYRLPVAFLFLVLLALGTSLILNRTMLGRGIYALGGSPESASRTGFNSHLIQSFVYGYIGLLSGVAGLIHVCLNRIASPFDLVGRELDVIAAVVLGGARITGGYGSVAGTMLGISLIVVINNSLILLGVSPYWQKVVIGSLILLGTALSALQQRRKLDKGLCS